MMDEDQRQVETLCTRYVGLPDVYGEGALFAFSGLDGPTCAMDAWTATLTERRFGLLIHTPRRAVLKIEVPSPSRVRLVTGDAVIAESINGPLVLAYSDGQTLVGCCPRDASVHLEMEGPTDAAGNSDETLLKDLGNQNGLLLRRSGERFAVVYGRADGELKERAARALDLDPIGTAEERLRFLAGVPSLTDPNRDRLLKKCFSVMKVNALSAEGPFKQLWSTPDRLPHRDCWLWDSVFHSLAMNHLKPQVAWAYLRSVLDTQQPDGMVPHQTGPNGRSSAITQPPLLAWGVWENYRALRDRETLAYALPRLQRYLTWNAANRDRNGNGLLEWFIEGDARCRSGESGTDNSPRFDAACLLDAVDFSVFQAEDLRYLGLIARELGREGDARAADEQATRVRRAIHALLWDEKAALYADRHFDGHLSPVQAVTGFLPLLLEDTPPERIRALSRTLRDPQRFASAFPLPSVALNDPQWGTDMWRGPTWINMNYFAALGFRRHGFTEEADLLREATIEHVAKYYAQSGVVFEYYESSDRRPPWECDRKGPKQPGYDFRKKYDPIRDYHWTAALTACLLMEGHDANG
jgi:hypothetical protein